MRSAILSGAISIVCLLGGGCAVGRPVHYYTIVPPAGAAVPPKPDGPVLLVAHIATPEELQDGRIRYRSGNEVGSYEYHRWIERPGAMTRECLIRALRASGKYHQVQEASSATSGDYLVRGKLSEFSEVDTPSITTRVSLHVELVDRKNGRTIWEHQYDREEPVSGKDMKVVVQSLDHNLQQVVGEAAAGIDSFLSTKTQG